MPRPRIEIHENIPSLNLLKKLVEREGFEHHNVIVMKIFDTLLSF
jgi:hypothetical protein